MLVDVDDDQWQSVDDRDGANRQSAPSVQVPSYCSHLLDRRRRRLMMVDDQWQGVIDSVGTNRQWPDLEIALWKTKVGEFDCSHIPINPNTPPFSPRPISPGRRRRRLYVAQ